MIRKTKEKQPPRRELLRTLRDILIEGSARTQQAVQERLLEKGFHVTQSSISRLLYKMEAVKSRDELGNTIYRLPREPLPPAPTNQLYSLVTKVAANEMLIVIHTSPGSASIVARQLDYCRERLNIMGTLAGDDVVFVAPTSVNCLEEALQEIKKLLY